ncbi:hypothetical protein PHLGIDRAFT_228774 [Phlebiopsis gigantea 11061_1 CR5-6]|uniref:Uncharacterized protein n=1 Tax=Phlebiopsis gigantea (strain 11061_1 CR5-6) TaxID=745531 RepID=A0A0C3S5P5_PHLG1|nr:hypothetical protein PHLGIDRAFT_228774 [Phlebiopsis gigantea 11061_1 CR5-6]
MSGPRNNLSDILKRRPQASSAMPAMSASQSQEGSTKPKFRAATKPSTSVLPVEARVPVQKAPSHTSFSTPGFGKKKPAPLSGLLSSPVVVSSTDSTPTSAQDQRTTTMAAASSTPIAQMITGLPSKRSSPSAFHVSEPPSKRPRPAAESYPSDKENLFESSEEITLVSDVDDAPQPPHRDKGKGRDIPHDSVPPASQRIIDFSVTTPARHSSRTLVRTPAPRTLPRPLQSASTLHKPVVLDSPGSLSQPTNIAAVGSAVEDADGRARRSATLDYSGLLVMSVEELLIAKDKILNMRAAMIDLRGNLDGDAGTDQMP